MKDGPIISQSIFDGENYDARKELLGWDIPNFKEKGWDKKPEISNIGVIKLEAVKSKLLIT